MEVRELTYQTEYLLHSGEQFVASDYPDDKVIGGDRGDAHQAAVSRPTRIEAITCTPQGFVLSGTDITTGRYTRHTNVHTSTRMLPPQIRNTIGAQVQACRQR